MSSDNPWKYAKQRDVTNNPYAKEDSGDSSQGKNHDNNDDTQDSHINGSHFILHRSTYARGIKRLREFLKKTSSNTHPKFTLKDGSKVYRPLSFKETIEARINNYETTTNPDGSKRSDVDREELLNKCLDTCSGIARKPGNHKFKLKSLCEELIDIDKSINKRVVVLDYDSFQGQEFDYKSDDIYHSPLTKKQFLDHKAYRFLYDEDTQLMNIYWAIIESTINDKVNYSRTFMPFSITEKDYKDFDEMRALLLTEAIWGSAVAGGNLTLGTNFLIKYDKSDLNMR